MDDNVTNRQILEEWLNNWRMRPTAVGDGAAAVDALRQAVEAGTPYSLVLLDGRMPDGDGLTVARQIREHVDISPTRIILLPSEDSGINIALFERSESMLTCSSRCNSRSCSKRSVRSWVARPRTSRRQRRFQQRRSHGHTRSTSTRCTSWWLRTTNSM